MGGGARGGKNRTRGPRMRGAGAEVFTEGWRPDSAIDEVKRDEGGSAEEEEEEGSGSEGEEEGAGVAAEVAGVASDEEEEEDDEEGSEEGEDEDSDEKPQRRSGKGRARNAASGNAGESGLGLPLAMWVSLSGAWSALKAGCSC